MEERGTQKRLTADALNRPSLYTGHCPACWFFGMVGMDGNPDIHVVGRTWIPMIPHRISPYQEILNAMRIEQPQELFEVGW